MNTSFQFLKILSVAPLVCLVLWAAFTDLKQRTISNRTCLLVLVFFFPSAWIYQFSYSEILWHLGTGFLALLLLMPLFLFQQMGGGDIKLISAVLVWYGVEKTIPLIFWITLSGGLIALLIIPTAIFLRRHDPSKVRWRDRYKDIKFPYAVAIALGVAITFADGWWFTR